MYRARNSHLVRNNCPAGATPVGRVQQRAAD
jgi:hypothetical protein